MSTFSARDPFGLPIHLQHEASGAGVNGFIEGFLAYEPRILEVLASAQLDDSVIVQSCAAALQMFAEAPGASAAARTHLARATRAALPCTEREGRFAQAVTQWVQGDVLAAVTELEALVVRYPRDLTAVKLGQYLAFNLGDSPTMLRLALHALPACAEMAWLHGMLAFAYEQCHFMCEAEDAARTALRMRPSEPWAQHALAHVMLTQGRLREGVHFLLGARDGWDGLTSFMRTHNWWHLAVFHIELGQGAQALELYDRQVWGVDKSYSQDQVGAVSLLARLELAGIDVGPRWSELASWLAPRVSDHVQPFLDMQYLYGLARAGRAEAVTLLANVERFAPHAPLATREAWVRVCVPACRGLAAHANGRWETAAQQLELALPRLTSIGGSHAQRDLFEQVRVDALQRSGEWVGVQNLLQPLANAQPQSVRLRRRLGDVHAALGLPESVSQSATA